MKTKLLLKLAWKDISKNKLISTILVLFLLLSSLLMAGGLSVMGTMSSATRGLNQAAQPPQYLQMHKGEYDPEQFDTFVQSCDYIEKSLVVTMLDIDNAKLYYNGETFEGCLMDNGFVVQNQGFDYLVDMNNQIALVETGEVGVPVYYQEELGIQVGDTLTIREGGYIKTLIVSIIIRDAQMNAALTSSKRFLVSETDWMELCTNTGELEYSFEFILKEGAKTSTLQRDYAECGLPSNGVAITGDLLNMINTLSYGLIALLLLAVSILLILIALMCLNYIIRATLIEENQSIGAMKAIGFTRKAISKLYLAKYTFISMIAAIIGYFAAIPFGHICSASVITYCGTGTEDWLQWILPLVGTLLLELIVVLRCRRMIRRNLKSSVVELIRDENNRKKEGHYHLPKKNYKWKNLPVALGELRCKWKEYIVLFLVFVLSSFLLLLPINMKATVEDPSFITYMGIGKCDIRIDIQYSEKMEEQKTLLEAYLEQTTQIEKSVILQNGYVLVENAEGELEYLRVSVGDERTFPLHYLSGHTPENAHEMALSYMEAKALGVTAGKTIEVRSAADTDVFTISGIYQDVTYGGKTAKAMILFSDESVEGYVAYLAMKDGADMESLVQELRQIVTTGRVTPVEQFVEQTLGGVTGYMGTLMIATTILSLALVILITTMFLKLITAREHQSIAIKKAIGYSSRDIRIQFGIRILTLQILAIAAGTLLTNLLGEKLFGLLLSSAGTAEIKMLIQPVKAYLLCPGIQVMACLITVICATGAVRKLTIRDQITE